MSGLGTMIGAFSQIPRGQEELWVFWFAVLWFIGLGIVSIIVGIGILEGKRWAWFGALVLCIFAFLKFPTGTVIAIIVLIGLFRSNVRSFLRIGVPNPPPAS